MATRKEADAAFFASSPRWAAYACAVCLVLSCVGEIWSVEGASSYDVCGGKVKPVKKGGSIDIGFAFWPNGTLEDWGEIDTGVIPCDDNNRTILTESGAGVSFFRVKVDELTVMVTSNQFHNMLKSPARGNNDYQVSVVAFRGRYRSSPRLVSHVSGANGDMEIVDSLTLVARFDEGHLRSLEWFDFGCGECFTDEKAICLNRQGQESCAVSKCPDGESCPTSMHIVFDGSDKNSQVFASAKQIRSLRKASVEDIYKGGRTIASSVVSKASSAAGGVGGDISSTISGK
ncbi:hypothetical protein BSKO_13458 [Bryopsis sp. KO-2023]|nr:hypothetical protein BSKO_13458 [Bryopsis sp. KO-2023]